MFSRTHQYPVCEPGSASFAKSPSASAWPEGEARFDEAPGLREIAGVDAGTTDTLSSARARPGPRREARPRATFAASRSPRSRTPQVHEPERTSLRTPDDAKEREADRDTLDQPFTRALLDAQKSGDRILIELWMFPSDAPPCEHSVDVEELSVRVLSLER